MFLAIVYKRTYTNQLSQEYLASLRHNIIQSGFKVHNNTLDCEFAVQVNTGLMNLGFKQISASQLNLQKSAKFIRITAFIVSKNIKLL